MAVVMWNEADFLDAYPQFAGKLTAGQMAMAWDVATSLIDNTAAAVIPYEPAQGVTLRQTMLWLLMCHLATLALWPLGQAGPVASSTEGSVSVTFHVPQTAGRAWWNQTPCGNTLWLLMQRYVAGGRYYGVKHIHPWG